MLSVPLHKQLLEVHNLVAEEYHVSPLQRSLGRASLCACVWQGAGDMTLLITLWVWQWQNDGQVR